MKISLNWLMALVLIHLVSGAQYDICETSEADAGGVGKYGIVVSPHYPRSMVQSKTCRLTIKACPKCHITLNFTSLQLPNCSVDSWSRGSCVYGCYHMYVHEPEYVEYTTHYYFAKDEGEAYTSVSNMVYLVLCVADRHYDGVKFRINYQIAEKLEEHSGTETELPAVGHITSPNFPHRYAMRKEVYTYLIQNLNPNGHIRLSFDDWSLSPLSRISIYFNNETHPEDFITKTGKDDRPYVLSTGPYLYVVFEAGEELYSIPYVGFKAVYNFVENPLWPNKPYTTCGEYYHSLFGGHFTYDGGTCLPGDKLDCIWVIMKYRDSCCDFHEAVSLKVMLHLNDAAGDNLEVRAGNSSEARLFGIYGNNNLTGNELISEDGFYLRLRATCSKGIKFNTVFTSFGNATKEGCENPFHFQCSNKRCISFTLKCDGYDHCGDNSDETSCAITSSTTTGKSCQTRYECRTGKGEYCVEEQCDGRWDCSDGSDERNCWMTDSPTSPPSHSGFLQYHNWGTYIPIGLVAILLAIIACIVISCCARRKHTRRRRQQRALANRMGIAGNVLPGQRMRSASETRLNINVDIVRYPESPPTYEEAMQTNVAEGVQNLAYSRTDSTDTFMPLPPPYTPNADDPLPIIYQLAASQSAPDIHSTYGRSSNPSVAGVHLGNLFGAIDPTRRRRGSSSQDGEAREGRRARSRHRRRRSRGTSQNPASEDQSALIFAAQDTAVNSSMEDNSNIVEDNNTQPDMHTQQSAESPAGTGTNAATPTHAATQSSEESFCDNTLTDNVMLDNNERCEFIELGDNLTIPSGVDPDRLTLQSETSGSFYSGADSASGCSTLDQSSVSSLNKGKTHRRSVSGVSCISKTSMEPSVSKVDEEPSECKCSCKCDCKPGISCGEECTDCDKPSHEKDNEASVQEQSDGKNSSSTGSPQEVIRNERSSSTANSAVPFTLGRNDDTASFV